jgi:hypothetical protein
MQLPGEAIWLPGAGELKFTEMHAAKAVEAYDPDLMLGQRKDTGEWAVFLPGNRANGNQPYPVLGLGLELPSPDRITQLLGQHDVRRRGQQMLDELDAVYDREQKALRDRASDAAEQVAEVIDSNMRKNEVHPFPRVYMRPKYGGGRVRSSG